MDHKLFKLINLGVCSYYLIVRSCFQIYAETFYLSPQEDATIIVWTFGVGLLMLSAGVFFFSRYRKERAACTDDDGTAASEAVELIGGGVILTMMLLKVIHRLCYYDYGALNLFFNPMGPLFSILFFMPFIVIAAVTIVKGLRTKGRRQSYDHSVHLYFLAVIWFVLYTCIHELLAWLAEMAAFRPYEPRAQEMYWILIQFALTTAALILAFAPLRFKNKFIETDKQYGKKLTAQSLIIGGSIIVMNMSVNILDFLISILVFLISDFGGFISNFSEVPRESFAVQLLPDLIFLIIGLAAIYYGNKEDPQS